MRIDSVNYLPQFILDIPEMKELLYAEQKGLDEFFDYIELMRNQTSVSTASIYLSRYEKMFGLNVSPALTDSERIGRILAKLNTRTNSTVDAIKTVVSSITGCDTEIEEYYGKYAFMIDVLRDNDQLINIEDIKAAVEIIKPAHLAFTVMMCWKWTIGIKVSSTIYKVAHDVCGGLGNDFDYCGETPELSYIGKIEKPGIQVKARNESHSFPYVYTGQYPIISTLGSVEDEDIKVNAVHETHGYDYDFTSFEAGIIPNISTLGVGNEENGQINVDIENYATPLLFAHDDGDYCGED